MARPATVSAEKIASVARELFIRQGIIRTEMKHIADECGISRTTLYRYFESKEAIAFHLAMETLQELGQPLAAHFPGNNSLERLSAMLHSFVDSMVAHPDRLRLIDDFDCTFSKAYPQIEAAEKYTAFMQVNRSILHEYFEQGIEDGSMRPDLDIPFVTALLVNALLGLGQRILPRVQLLRREQGYAEEYLYALLDALLRDLSAQNQAELFMGNTH